MKKLIILLFLFPAILYGQNLFRIDTSRKHEVLYITSDSNNATFVLQLEKSRLSIEKDGTINVNNVANLFLDIETYFKKQLTKNYETTKKLEFYESRFGKIKGSINDDCIELEKPTIKIEFCTPKSKLKINETNF